MGNAKKHQPVKLICGLIFKNEEILDKARSSLEKNFGKIDFESQTLPFSHTDYYEAEFGRLLMRRFVSFARLIPPESLTRIKNITNNIEKKFSFSGKRRINLDPGYLELSKLVLASTKDFYHRIYIGKGIFAETTLIYQDKSFKSHEWTYPDYKAPEYAAIFEQIRRIYLEQVKNK